MESSFKLHVQGAALIYFSNNKRFTEERDVYRYLKQSEKQYKMYSQDEINDIESLYYSGPMRYGNKKAIVEGKPLTSIDLVTAYGSVLLHSILPGRVRTKYDGLIHPRPGEIAIVTVAFAEREPDPRLEAYFLNQAAFKKAPHYALHV